MTSLSLLGGPIWLVGCGHMGRALLDRWLQAGLAADDVVVIDPAPPPSPPAGVVVVRSPAEAAGRSPGAAVLAIKPQLLDTVAAALAPRLPAGTPLVSILAGASCSALQRCFPSADVVRAMPNTPARIGRGVTALFAAPALDATREWAERLLAAAGRTLWLDDEALFDVVTAVSGSGPAYLFAFIEALGQAGEALGLPASTSRMLALETVAGAAELAARSTDPPAVLRQQVTSAKGTTAAALDVLMPALGPLVEAAARAAARRSSELADEIGCGRTSG